ncbi:unnamed protein product [Caenorhabditis bovis]|uniref:Uncharacterized protein n=1 Tax=Caenorhabditis bovis TaxID=2654633 RepID=A0A8S1FBY4_9PELO|nr:unnamed protein product [Caenorhabditis bovis]
MSVDTSTRLLQLDGLLESKNRTIRHEAALAFGKFSIFDENVQKIFNKHLTSQSWDARVAAGKALHSILENMKNGMEPAKLEPTEMFEELKKLDVQHVLNTFKPLLGDSEIQEANNEPSRNNNKKQRELLDQHLEYNHLTGITSKKFLSDDELMETCSSSKSVENTDSQELSKIVKKIDIEEGAGQSEEFDETERKKKLWRILRGFIDQVTDQRWHARHGSAIAVCQIATCAFTQLSSDLIDSCLYLYLHVLILDKFNDFISGRNATAPVREQCAQALVHLMRNIDVSRKDVVLQIMVQMMNTPGEQNWNVRQSGLLVMKYYFAIAKSDGERATFDKCFELVIQSLNDTVDDVTGCAVKTLSSILSNEYVSKEDASKLVSRVMYHVWRLLLIESTKEQLRAGLDALCIDLIEIVELWLNWNAESSITRENLLVICSMLDVSFPQRCEKIIRLLDLDLSRGDSGKLQAQDVFSIVKQLYRILLFSPPADSLAFVEMTFLTFQKLYKAYEPQLIAAGEICKTIGVWTGCLLFDHRSPMIDVFEYCVDGISSVKESPCERMCSEEMRFLSEKEKDRTYLVRKILCAKFLAIILESLFESDADMNGQKVSTAIQLVFIPYFQSTSIMHNLGAAVVVNEWSALYRATINTKNAGLEPPMTIVQLADNVLKGVFGSAKHYDEMSNTVNMLTKDCNDFIEYCAIRGFDRSKIDVMAADSIEEISRIAYTTSREFLKTEKQKESLDGRYGILTRTIESVKIAVRTNANRISALLASALFYFGNAPEKLTPQIRPLVETMQMEENDAIAAEIFRGSVPLLVMYSWPRNPRPYVKVLAKAIEAFASCSHRIPKPNTIANRYCVVSLQRLTGNDVDDDESGEASSDASTPRIAPSSRNAELILLILCQFSTVQLPEFYANFDLNENVDELVLLHRLELHECLWSRVGSRLSDESTNKIFELLASHDPALRFAAAKAIETFTKSQCGDTISRVYERLTTMASNLLNDFERLGAVEAYLRLSCMDAAFLNGLATLLCPIVFRLLTDKCEIVRDAAGEAFRRLVPLVTVEDPNFVIPDLCDALKRRKLENTNFIHVLSSPSALPRIEVAQIKGGLDGKMLREYQLEGITWMRFLRHYGLNGILADDMGLGKTLQTMCAIAMSLDYDNLDKKSKCSLIVCPRTLVDHWCLEWKRYFPNRTPAQKHVGKSIAADVCVVAYEDLKSNQLIQKRVWNYVVLDEGHIMRNTKTQIWRSANSLLCKSRLILSGTPIQNSPADLWALFSWLMPGYLGTEKQFRAQFLRKILKCRNAKATEADLKAGSSALSQLHRLILPFVLRRMKGDVLKELPDKNVQDYECELSDDQKDIYRFVVDCCTSNSDDIASGRGISALHTLITLRKLVDHPILSYETLCQLNAPQDILEKGQNARSGKLEGLGQLLVECGICRQQQDGDETDEIAIASDASVSHRALIFCQWKSSAKLVSQKLSSGEFGSKVSHLVLDGDVAAADRMRLVNRFNEDKTIDVLVLTTHIGGVGLNLTGADTVIFLDHDWNPMKDLQAIDRAHRLGQTRKVNVYRLITQGTIEEKVMSLAKFKLNTAQALISDDNTSLQSMQTTELMEMFTLDGDEKKAAEPARKRKKMSSGASQAASGGGGGLPAHEWNLAEMWDESQYDDFQVSKFLKSA